MKYECNFAHKSQCRCSELAAMFPVPTHTPPAAAAAAPRSSSIVPLAVRSSTVHIGNRVGLIFIYISSLYIKLKYFVRHALRVRLMAYYQLYTNDIFIYIKTTARDDLPAINQNLKLHIRTTYKVAFSLSFRSSFL